MALDGSNLEYDMKLKSDRVKSVNGPPLTS
jgi:hypothetical protein